MNIYFYSRLDFIRVRLDSVGSKNLREEYKYYSCSEPFYFYSNKAIKST